MTHSPPDWRPAASATQLRRRARVLALIRGFFAERGVLEVETPTLSRSGATDPHIQSFVTEYHGPDPGRLYLQTSPEFPMKRLLASGSGDIYQICRVFRDGETGRLHNPEFTLLEWYRVGYDHHRLMDEVEALVRRVLAPDRAMGSAIRVTYAEAFEQSLALDVHAVEVEGLRSVARARGLLEVELGEDIDAWRDLLWTHLVAPWLPPTAFVYAYPASQAALARVTGDEPPVAERFELFLDGIEIANGFHELADAAEQRRRFDGDNTARAGKGLASVPVDERLLVALAEGLPDCAGVALGVDRLLMVASGAIAIRQVLAFPVDLA